METSHLETTEQHEQKAAFVQDMINVQGRLFGYILSLLPDRSSADDVLQETNMVIWSKANEFQSGTDFAAWALRIAYFEVLKYRQNCRRDRLCFNEDLLNSLANRAAQRSESSERLSGALQHCLSKLSERQRTLLHRRYMPGVSVKMMADELNRSAASISQTLHRIRSVLNNCVHKAIARESMP